MQPEFEVSWHGGKWRDDRVDVTPPDVVRTAQGLSPTKRPNERRGGRKPVIAPAVAKEIRNAEKPLSALELYARIKQYVSATCTVAGVQSALFRLRTDGFIETCEQRSSFGRFGCTYRWKHNPHEALDAVKLRARKAEIGRMGGLKAAENRRAADAL